MCLKYKVLLYSIAFGLLLSLVSAEFPIKPKPCKFGDTECIKDAMNYYLKQKNGGEESINLVPLEPLNIKKTTIKQGTDSRLSVELTLSNSQGFGLNTVEVYKVKGFHSDLTKQHEIRFKMDKGSIIGNYEVNGRLFFFPINGSGKSNMTIVNSDVILKFNGTSYKKNDNTYMKVEKLRIRLKPERVYFNFENLFNSDKELSNNMNLFLNENWKDIFDEMEDSVNKVYSDIYSEIITKVFSKFPYKKYFLDE